MKKYKTILPIITATLLILSGCGSKSPVYDGTSIVVKPAPNVEQGNFKLNNISKPIVPSINEEKMAEPEMKVSSIYADSLSISRQKAYNELLNTILIDGKNYIPSEKINADELKRMMRIILLDEPAAYALKYSYSYELDNNKNVKKVNLEYHPLLLTQKAKEYYNESIKSGSVSEIKMAENTFKAALGQTALNSDTYSQNLKSFLKSLLNSDDVDKYIPEYNNHLKKTIFAVSYLGAATEEGAAKYFSAVLRSNGVNAANIFGERTSSLLPSGGYVNPFSGFKEEQTQEGDTFKVNINTDGVNVWNMFKIGSQWYHADVPLAMAINQTVKKVSPDSEFSDNDKFFAFGMSDAQSAISKLSFHNESILGVYPMAYDDLASSTRTNSSIFIENSNQTRLSDDLSKFLPNVSREDEIMISFNQSDVFNAFSLSKDLLFNKYRTQKLIAFNNYKSLVIPEIQSVLIYGIK